MDNPVNIKKEIRAEALRRRDAIPFQVRRKYSNLIGTKLLAFLYRRKCRKFHIYLNFRSEVETLAIIKDLIEDKMRVVAPVMVEKDGVEDFEHAVLKSLADLEVGLHGIMQPMGNVLMNKGKYDAIIVPMVAFDRSGARIGYGQAFYDRFLKSVNQEALKIGIAFSVQEFPSIPQEPHDVQLDFVVTEKGMINCKENRGSK